MGELKWASRRLEHPPVDFFNGKKCSTQRILCQVDDRNHMGGLENTFVLPTFETEGICLHFDTLVEKS